MYCASCGKQMDDKSRFCPECGSMAAEPGAAPNAAGGTWEGTRDQTHPSDTVFPSNPPKSPMHCWWNLLWPGIGHIVQGQVGKGVMLMAVSFAANFVLPFINFVIVPGAIIDAYKVGKALASGKTVRKWDWFPQ